MSAADLLLAAFGIALGGFLKGATGAGAPVVGVPILALVLGVPQAVAVFSVLNLFSNLWQGWAYRAALAAPRFAVALALAGGAGAILGTLLLASLSTETLMGGLAMIVFLYIALRLTRPEWRLARPVAERVVLPVGFSAGLLQGAGGISAPVSVTFLNAMRLERGEFIATISVLFAAMSVVQIPTLAAVGILDWERAGLSALAAIPLFGAMPVGEWAARRVSKAAFDRVILLLLAAIALRLLYGALT